MNVSLLGYTLSNFYWSCGKKWMYVCKVCKVPVIIARCKKIYKINGCTICVKLLNIRFRKTLLITTSLVTYAKASRQRL